MTNHTNGTTAVHRFERNHYFYGKLLTVRDMAAEQAYHLGTQRTLSRFVTDWGGVCGLDVETSVEPVEGTDEERLVVEVGEGLALDRCGRLVVVEDAQRRTVTLPPTAAGEETDTVSVYVEYDECSTDPVPAAKMEHACEEQCEDNRIVQGAEVTVEPGDPGDYHKSIADIDFPDAAALGLVDGLGGQTLGIRGDLEIGSGDSSDQGTLDLTLSDSAPSDTIIVDLSPLGSGADADTLVGTIQIPRDVLLGPEGFVTPGDGVFAVSGTLGDDRSPLTIDGTVTVETTGDDVNVSGTLGFAEDDGDSLSVDIDFTVDVADWSITGAIEVQDADVTVDGGLVVGDHDEEFVVSGEVSVTFNEVGGRGSSEEAVVRTIAWEDAGEEVAGFLVDKPATAADSDDVVDLDAVLSGLARSYYEHEPRTECPPTDDGRVLLGTVTSESDDWSLATFERGPLVYTNDMLFDILARHVADFDNPHEVALGVSPAEGPGGDARIGVAEAEGLTGGVDLASSDGSVTITPDSTRGSIDLAAEGGLGEAFEEYYVFEKSLWTKVRTYDHVVRRAPDLQIRQQIMTFAYLVVRLAAMGLEERVYASPDRYVDFLRGDLFSVDDLDLETVSDPIFLEGTEQPVDPTSVVELERAIDTLFGRTLAEGSLPLELSDRALEQLEAALDEFDQTGEGAAELAMAQDRVAEAAQLLLVEAPETVTIDFSDAVVIAEATTEGAVAVAVEESVSTEGGQ